MTDIDTNISNYTLSELLDIVGIDNEDIDSEVIIEKTDSLIKQFKTKNPELADFFMDVQTQLLEFAKGLEYNEEIDTTGKIVVEGFGNNEAIYPAGENQVNDWYTNQALKQSDENQYNKITQRKQKIDVFGNTNVPMKREQIATTDTYQLPVKQDSLNPNLKNTISRFVNLDSQFRQYTNGIDTTSTDYTLDLSDTLKDALSLLVYSYQIPYSWYVIDDAYGNTCFWLHDTITNQYINVYVPPGNYTAASFQTQLNNSFLEAGITTPPVGPPYNLSANQPVYYNANNGIITLFLYDGSYNDPLGIQPSFTINQNCSIVFYDFTGILNCREVCLNKSNHFFNSTLGWIMGYRLPYIYIDPSGNKASSILDLNGTKYLILAIDDYNQNHVNNSLVSIAQYSNNLKIPDYYSQDIPYTCVTPAQLGNNLEEIVNESILQSVIDDQTTSVKNGLLIAGKYQQEYVSRQQILPSAPRTLTQSQIYTINEINKNNNNLTNYLSKAPTTADILAVLPIKTALDVPVGSLLIEYSGSLQDNIRTYFGPVNIDRMKVNLLDDKGNILNLNGNDWCVTLICNCLYQY